MTATRVSGAVAAATTSVASQSLTLPTLLAGDLIILGHVSSTTGTVTPPSGYTQLITTTEGTALTATLWTKTAVSGDSGATVTWTNTSSQRLASIAQVYRGVSAVNAYASLIETATTTGHVSASATTTDRSITVQFLCERSSTPSTTISPPAGFTRWNQAWGTGTGAASVAAGDNQSVAGSGTTVGGGTWTTDVANNNFISFTLALTPAGPVIDAGPTQTVTPSTAVTLTGIETSVGAVSSRAWTQVSGPTVTLSGASTQTANFTPSVSGVYVFQYALTDDSGSASDTVQVNVTATSARPASLVSGSWTVIGGAASAPVALADESDATGLQSSAVPSGDAVEVKFVPPAVGSTPWTVSYNALTTAASPSISVLVELRQGSTVIASWTDVWTTTVQTFLHTLTTGQMASVSDVGDIRVRWTATAGT